MNRNAICARVLGVATALLMTAGVAAQETVSREDADAVTDGEAGRYTLVAVEDDILRVDRQNGTVTVCNKRSDAWRCRPVPLAEEAYLAEINDLAEEVDKLTARLEELEGEDSGGKGTSRVPPGSALERPKSEDKDLGTGLDEKDEEELEKVLTFTEGAMRRFFGMVRDLQKDFEGDGKSE